MKFITTRIPEVMVIEPELMTDERGFFGRSFCRREFKDHGLETEVVQCNNSMNLRKGTLRGMHYQAPPRAEAKLVRCIRGEMWDAVVDLREESPMYCRWFSVRLTAENQKMLYVPEGCAHGFVTLVDHTEVFYQMFEEYSPEHARGVRWNDPCFGIEWPVSEPILSDRDRNYPDHDRSS